MFAQTADTFGRKNRERYVSRIVAGTVPATGISGMSVAVSASPNPAETYDAIKRARGANHYAANPRGVQW